MLNTPMDFKVYWSVSGDHFKVNAIDNDLVQWFIESYNKDSTDFATEIFPEDLKSSPTEKIKTSIVQNIDKVNALFGKLKMQKISTPQNFYNQKELNSLHKNWISIIQAYPNLDLLLHKLDVDAFCAFHSINRQLHVLESSFVYKFRPTSGKRLDNIFPGQQYPTGVFNVSLSYADHGRNSYEKFINYDEDSPNDHELSQWRTLGGQVTIVLSRPYTVPHSPEYVEYCSRHSLTLTSATLPLGNLPNIDSITQARYIMDKNLLIPNNYLRFDL